jgi:hypothetical protein
MKFLHLKLFTENNIVNGKMRGVKGSAACVWIWGQYIRKLRATQPPFEKNVAQNIYILSSMAATEHKHAFMFIPPPSC